MLSTAEMATADHITHLKCKVFDASGEGIIITDPNGVLIVINAKFEEITGYSSSDIIGQTPRLLKSGRQGDGFYRDMWALLLEQGWWSGLLWNKRKSGDLYLAHLSVSAIYDENGLVDGYIGIMRDVTDQKLQEDRIKYLANHDMLTGLLNRHALDIRLERAIQHARRRKTDLALMFLDLDRFKQINDTLGHEVGDGLLKAVAERIGSCVRADDTIARQGGDEFIVLLEDINRGDKTRLAHSAQRIVDALGSPFQIGGCTLTISVSVGIALYPDNGATQSELVKHADLAMYHAKECGRSNYQFFNAELDDKIRHSVALEGDLRAAIADGGKQFMLHYQPKICLATGKVVSLEALMRWNHPRFGLVPPSEFIGLAEDARLITPLWRWLISEVSAQIETWGAASKPVAVNVSPAQFRQEGLVDEVLAIIQSKGVAPSMIEIEVTEGVFINDTDNAVRILNEIRAAGFRVALDDFGTGYSSLSYLLSLPIDVLKIDRAFVAACMEAGKSMAIIRCLVALGQELGVQIVAEGVESHAQAQYLSEIGCDVGQGYLFSRPIPASQVLPYLRRRDGDGNQLFWQGIESHVFGDALLPAES